jgi:AcrR family transcriptional regulator
MRQAASQRLPDGPRRRRQAERRGESCERILDAAEEAFAKRGFFGVTLREVATLASTDTTLVHYYFSDKRGLFDAVVARRAEAVNSIRRASLEAYEREQGAAMTAEGVIAAYLNPTFEFVRSGGAGARNYGAVIAKANASSSSDEYNVATSPFDPVVHKLASMLKRVRPECSEVDIYWFYHMLSGAITLSLAETGRIDVLSDGRCKSTDSATILNRMIKIFGAGFSGLPANKGTRASPVSRTKTRA